jgi:D-serine dehydratase
MCAPRAQGATVVEHTGDYGAAVAAGRASAAADPRCHFVDDESSEALFLGYSAAGRELAAQLAGAGVPPPTRDRPLVVHLPCGVGGAPGGIALGLKHALGAAVEVLLAEPTHAPCALLALAAGRGADPPSVAPLGLQPTATAADGLAVGRASALACAHLSALAAGAYTASEGEMLGAMAALHAAEGRFVEPSCAAALLGVRRLREAAAAAAPGSGDAAALARLLGGTQVFWMTGGALVPAEERARLLQQGAAAGGC